MVRIVLIQVLNGKCFSVSLLASHTHYTVNSILFKTFTLLFTYIGPIFWGRPPEEGTDRLYRNVSEKLPPDAA